MPNRSLLRACGMTDEEIRQPIIGVVSAYSEIIPGHINLDKIADAVKAGVRMAGGTPVLVPAIGVCDGIAMGHIGMKYSLASRELIADSVETLAQAHQMWFIPHPELRQDRSRYADGGCPFEYSVHSGFRRPDAGRPFRR